MIQVNSNIKYRTQGIGDFKKGFLIGFAYITSFAEGKPYTELFALITDKTTKSLEKLRPQNTEIVFTEGEA